MCRRATERRNIAESSFGIQSIEIHTGASVLKLVGTDDSYSLTYDESLFTGIRVVPRIASSLFGREFFYCEKETNYEYCTK